MLLALRWTRFSLRYDLSLKHEYLYLCFLQTTLADILPDIQPALGSKNPQVKEGTLKFLGRCLASSTTPIPPLQIKPVSEALSSLLEDSFEGARNEAATCLGTLMKMVGERPLNALMDSLADVRKTKVKEAYEKAVVKCKAGGAPKPAPPPVTKEQPKKKTPVAIPPAPAKKPEPELPADEELLASVEHKPLKKPPARFLVCFLYLYDPEQA
jgi:cytoskeleton-associated protein 5